jgi:hypothetical protein
MVLVGVRSVGQCLVGGKRRTLRIGALDVTQPNYVFGGWYISDIDQIELLEEF